MGRGWFDGWVAIVFFDYHDSQSCDCSCSNRERGVGGSGNLLNIFRANVDVAKATHAYGSIRTDLTVYGVRRASFAKLSLLRRRRHHRRRLSHVGCAFISINNFVFHIFIVVGRPCPSNLWHFMGLLKYIDGSARVHMRSDDARKDWCESAAPRIADFSQYIDLAFLFKITKSAGIECVISWILDEREWNEAHNWISIYSN